MKKKTRVKSIGFVLITVAEICYIIDVVIELISSKMTTPIWFVVMILASIAISIIGSLITRRRDINDSLSQYWDIKRYEIFLVIAILFLWQMSAIEITVNTFKEPPVDLEILPKILLHTIIYFFVFIVFFLFAFHCYGKRALRLATKNNEEYRFRKARTIGAYAIGFVIYTLILLVMRRFWFNFYGYYTTDYSRYGDMARVYCTFGGLLSVFLILSIQTRSRFVPFKLLNGILKNMLKADKEKQEEKTRS